MKIKRLFLCLIVILSLVLSVISITNASAQTVCSPATELSVPVVLNQMGKFCWHTTTLCYQVNSWYTTTLSINGTDYRNMFVLASSIPPLNGGYTITFDGGNIPYAPGHLEITGPYQGSGTGPCDSVPATSTPAGPTATLTRTPTNGPTATRTRTPTSGPSLTPTRTATPVIPTATSVGGTCSPATTITAPFVSDGIGTFCWRISSLGFINSNNLDLLTVNGQNFTNLWANTAMLPPRQADGFWYIKRIGNFTWSHFEVQP